MKRIILLSAMLILMMTSMSQIMLEHTYPASASLTELSLSGYKYYLMDATNNQCKLYNLDHSLWKTIPLSVPSNMYLYDIKYVSETLFNTDSKVELAYTYYSYDTIYYYYTYYSKVINESGFEILSMPGAGYLDLKSTSSNGTKFFAYIYNYSVLPSTVNTQVYSLPGSLPTGGIATEPVISNRFPFPNPAKASVTIPYSLPDGVNTAQVLLLNSSGKPVKTYTVDRAFDSVLVQTEDLPRGIYIYQVKAGSEIISAGRVIHE
ncbi:MAG: T9SS type A sorting domain-containing protein [Bacteroidota bacterium]